MEFGYTFKNEELLNTALAHSSYANEHKKESNERLEFLGDSVLSIIVSEYLFSRFPEVDEGELTKMRASLVCEKSLAGFAEEIGKTLTAREIELLPLSAKLLTYECGIRSLTDYLEGDTYFKIHRPNHNLDRARTQLAMCKDIISKYDILSEIVRKAR